MPLNTLFRDYEEAVRALERGDFDYQVERYAAEQELTRCKAQIEDAIDTRTLEQRIGELTLAGRLFVRANAHDLRGYYSVCVLDTDGNEFNECDKSLRQAVTDAVERMEEADAPVVHNHGPEEGPGLACRERMVNGRLVGECLGGGSR